MQLRTLIRVLVSCGAILLLYGFFMETTVESDYSGDRIVSLDLQARQIKLLITGGILFVSGILLSGFRMLKQSPADLVAENAQDSARRDAAGLRIKAAWVACRGRGVRVHDFVAARAKAGFVFRLIVSALSAGWVGFAAGKVLLLLAVSGVPSNEVFFAVWKFSNVLPLFCAAAGIVYVFRSMEAVKPILKLLQLCLGLTVAYVVFLSARVGWLRNRLHESWSPTDDGYARFVDGVIAAERELGVTFAILLGLAALLYFVTRKARLDDYQ